jgi:flagellar assembly protein FliH
MIVRGAVLSEKRVSLTSTPERPPLAAVRPSPPPPVELPPPPPPEPIVITVPAPLSLDIVSRWIAEQDDVTRKALARQLADDVEDLQRNAREKGWDAGLAAGRAEADKQAAHHRETLDSIARAAKSALDTQYQELSEQCAEIVAAALTRIAGPLLATPEAALGAVLEVLKRATDEGDLIVRVSAADLPALHAAEGVISRALAGRKFSLTADTRVSAGGAIVESAVGSVDGRLEVQLRNLCDTVLSARAAQRETP